MKKRKQINNQHLMELWEYMDNQLWDEDIAGIIWTKLQDKLPMELWSILHYEMKYCYEKT